MIMYALCRIDFVDNSASAADCEGHGTHVASTAVGRTVGVAKEAKIVAVRVLDCSGSGTTLYLSCLLLFHLSFMWLTEKSALLPDLADGAVLQSRLPLNC